MKRLTTFVSVLAVLVATTLGIGANAAPAAGKGVTVDTYPVAFTVISENCNQLPAGMSISGKGTFTDIFTASGLESQGRGTATDNLGNTYVWHYASHLVTKNGGFTDQFSVSGNGPAAYVTAFKAVFTGAGINPVWVHGDPYTFPLGPGRCDPL